MRDTRRCTRCSNSIVLVAVMLFGITTCLFAEEISENDFIASTHEQEAFAVSSEEAPTYVIEEVNTVGTNSSHTVAYSVNWTVAPGSTLTSNIKTFASSGDAIKFDLTYTPSNSSVAIGMVSCGTFTYYTRTNGSLNVTLSTKYTGLHQFRVKNNSDSAITIKGTYRISATSEFEYMFKEPYMATYLSSTYGEERPEKNHYAIDITTGTPGVIKNYPVYNALSGTVKKSGYFSDNVTTCVAVLHDNGITSRYLHMDIGNNGLAYNDYINTGVQVGKVSDRGSSSAYHLHYDLNTINATAGTNLNESNTIDPTLVFFDISFSS